MSSLVELSLEKVNPDLFCKYDVPRDPSLGEFAQHSEIYRNIFH